MKELTMKEINTEFKQKANQPCLFHTKVDITMKERSMMYTNNNIYNFHIKWPGELLK